jgi:outer membrane lipoprotein-sorting protein
MNALRLVLAALVLVAAGAPGFAQSPEEKGYAIAKRAEELTDKYSDYTASGKMILRTGGGGEAVREFDFKARNISGGNQNLLVFSWPGDIRDTGLLTVGATGRNDDQWIYLPAARRVKRISSSSRSGSFVGSEFAYEDMVDQALDDFSYLWLRDESCCHVVEAYPKFSSGYEKQIVWFDMSSGLPVQIEYFPKRGSKLKVLAISGYRNYGGVWRPSLMRMKNHLNGRSTDLSWSDYRFNVGLAPSEFTTRALERGQ